MTKVNVSGYNERLYLEVCGHSVPEGGGESADSKIVCAAVSILLLSAAQRLCEMESMGDFNFASISVESGYALFDLEPRDDSRERTEEIIEMLLSGFSLLEEHYPELIAVI